MIGTPTEYSFWETTTWDCRRALPRDCADLPGIIAFRPDGKLLAICRSAWAVQLIEPDTGREVATLTPPDAGIITAACFSPDGTRLAVATSDRVIQLWNLRLIGQRLAGMGLDWAPPRP